MPPRFVVFGIVAFWLAVTGFAFYRDVWPRLFSNEPPPVSIELADEARQNVPSRWAIARNGARVGRLTTQMQYLDATDEFVFTYRYADLALDQSGVTLKLPEAVSEVRLSRAGHLKAQKMTAKAEALLKGVSIGGGSVSVRATVTDGTLSGRAEIKSTLFNLEGDLDPVPVPAGQPLNPLQPVNRIANVRPGREWTVHESNPLQDAVGNLFRKQLSSVAGLRLPEEKKRDSLVARVDSEQQELTVRGASERCWVIEYRRAEPVARTWVRATDGKVLKQEAFEKGETLSFERED
jgi:hypothetical protein